MITFEINPYISAGEIRFGMTEGELLAVGFSPKVRSKNRRGEPNWMFDGFSLRLGASDNRVCEVGFSRACKVSMMGVEVFADPEALGKLLGMDAEVFEFYGFLVFFGLGITLTGFHDRNESEKAVTAFARGHWDGNRNSPAFRKWG